MAKFDPSKLLWWSVTDARGARGRLTNVRVHGTYGDEQIVFVFKQDDHSPPVKAPLRRPFGTEVWNRLRDEARQHARQTGFHKLGEWRAPNPSYTPGDRSWQHPTSRTPAVGELSAKAAQSVLNLRHGRAHYPCPIYQCKGTLELPPQSARGRSPTCTKGHYLDGYPSWLLEQERLFGDYPDAYVEQWTQAAKGRGPRDVKGPSWFDHLPRGGRVRSDNPLSRPTNLRIPMHIYEGLREEIHGYVGARQISDPTWLWKFTAGKTPERARWDIMWAADKKTTIGGGWVEKAYGFSSIKDDHIDSALRAIFKELAPDLGIHELQKRGKPRLVVGNPALSGDVSVRTVGDKKVVTLSKRWVDTWLAQSGHVMMWKPSKPGPYAFTFRRQPDGQWGLLAVTPKVPFDSTIHYWAMFAVRALNKRERAASKRRKNPEWAGVDPQYPFPCPGRHGKTGHTCTAESVVQGDGHWRCGAGHEHTQRAFDKLVGEQLDREEGCHHAVPGLDAGVAQRVHDDLRRNPAERAWRKKAPTCPRCGLLMTPAGTQLVGDETKQRWHCDGGGSGAKMHPVLKEFTPITRSRNPAKRSKFFVRWRVGQFGEMRERTNLNEDQARNLFDRLKQNGTTYAAELWSSTPGGGPRSQVESWITPITRSRNPAKRSKHSCEWCGSYEGPMEQMGGGILNCPKCATASEKGDRKTLDRREGQYGICVATGKDQRIRAPDEKRYAVILKGQVAAMFLTESAARNAARPVGGRIAFAPSGTRIGSRWTRKSHPVT